MNKEQKEKVKKVIDDLVKKFVKHQQRKPDNERINKDYYYGTTLKNTSYVCNPTQYGTRRLNEYYPSTKTKIEV